MVLGPVPHMQTLLAENLRKGISGLGNKALQKSQFGLESAMAEHTMGRQEAADERQAGLDALMLPGRQRDAQMAQGQMDEYAQPIHISMLAPNFNALEHGLWTTDDGDPKDAMLLKFAEMFGGKWDTTEDSPTRGQLFVNGKVITKGDLDKNMGPVQAFMKARTGLDHAIRSKEEANERDRNKFRITEEEYTKRKGFIEDLKTNIPFQMQMAQEHIDFISQFANTGNPMFQGEMSKGLERWKSKYNKLGGQLEKQQVEAGKREFEMEKLYIQEEGKDYRARLAAGSKRKGPTQKEIDAHNLLGTQHLVGWGQQKGYDIRMDEESGAVMARMTKAEIKELKKQATKLGFSVYDQLTEDERDRPGWFTGDDPLYSISIVPKFAEKGRQPVKTPGGTEKTANAFIGKFLPGQVEQPAAKLQPSHGAAPKLQSSHEKKKVEFFKGLAKRVGDFDAELNKNIEDFIEKAKKPSTDDIYRNVPRYK